MQSKPKRLRILLIVPPYHRLIGLRDSYLPLGASALSAYLEQNGYEVRVYNAENFSEDLSLSWGDPHINQKLLEHHRYYDTALRNEDYYVWQEIENVINYFLPDIVGITTMSIKLASSWRIASIVKKILPNSYVVLGGPHPTIAPEDSMRSKDVDFVVRGEGELTLKELCDILEIGHMDKLSNIKGLTFRKDGKVHHNNEREMIADISELPMPARHLSILQQLYDPNSMGNLVTGRGCPYRCGFCGAKSLWTRKVRYRPVSAVLDEIEKTMTTYNIRYFYFWDDSFTVHKNRLIEICTAIIKNNYNIEWGCTTRVNLIDEERLDVMKESGCKSIDIGIESGSPRIIKLIKKDITFEQINRAVRLTKERGITCNAFFMIGLPHENEEDISLTMKMIQELDISRICLSIFTPYPGSELYEEALVQGLLKHDHDWSRYSHHSPNNYFVKDIPRGRFQELVKECAELVDRKNSGG